MQPRTTPGITVPSRDDVAVVVVTFYPDASFTERVKTLTDQFAMVIIVDNSGPAAGAIAQLEQQHLQTIANSENVGLGRALNMGCDRARELGFNWAVTLDQDTVLAPDYLPSMLAAWTMLPTATPILGCNYFNVSRSAYRFTPSQTPHAKQALTTITSGCLTHLPTWAVLGKFREDYFIDSIDHEFCLRARKAGYPIAVNQQPLMNHTIGENTHALKLLGKLKPYTHSVWRTYTTTRNTLRTMVVYAGSEPAWCIKKTVGLVLEFLAIIFFERQKNARIRAFSLGIRDGYRNKMGAPGQHVMNLDKP